MSAAATALVKAGIALLTDPKARKALGWALVAILSPVILVVAFLCSLGSGTAQHNNAMVDYSFYGTDYSGEIPAEFEEQMSFIRTSFASLDSAVASVNATAEASGLDPIQVKAAFLVLCSEGQMSPETFVNYFYTTEQRTRTVYAANEGGELVPSTESYTVTVPRSLAAAYASLSTALGQEISAENKTSVQEVYTRIAGKGGEDYEGSFLRGNDPSVELDVSTFTDSSTKNAHDLVAYVTHAWESGWGYVWGTYGHVLTESLLDSKLRQYPDGVGKYEDFIRANWLDGRTADCVGLIKGYGWLDPSTLTIKYGTNGMPDITANTMYHNATVSGPISTIPDTPGLAVWMDGHIGVYIGGGEVIEASGTKKGVVKTQLAGRGWTHWLEVPYISYG